MSTWAILTDILASVERVIGKRSNKKRLMVFMKNIYRFSYRRTRSDNVVKKYNGCVFILGVGDVHKCLFCFFYSIFASQWCCVALFILLSNGLYSSPRSAAKCFAISPTWSNPRWRICEERVGIDTTTVFLV